MRSDTTAYALLLLISKCRKLDVFWRNFFVSKLCLCISFYNYQVCVCVLFCKHHQKCKCHQWYQCLKVSIESIKNNVTNSHFPKFNPNFRQQGLMLGDHFYRWTHHNISFCFGVTAIWAHKSVLFWKSPPWDSVVNSPCVRTRAGWHFHVPIMWIWFMN